MAVFLGLILPSYKTPRTIRQDAMPAANDIRKGQVIKHNGEPHLVMETQHRTPGNLRAFVQVKMRNLRYGTARLGALNRASSCRARRCCSACASIPAAGLGRACR